MAKSIDGLSKQPKDQEDKAVGEETKPAAEAPKEEPTPEKAAETPKEEPKETSTEEPVKEEKVEPAPAAEEKAAEETHVTESEPAASPAEVPTVVPPVSPSAKPEGFDLFPEPSVVVTGPPTWLWWLLLVAGAGALGFLAYDLTRGRIDNWLASDSPTPTPTVSASSSPEASPSASASATATPTPSPSSSATTVDKAKVTLRVLNGTTQAGAAAATKTTLEKAGFTVKSIGNAKSQNYTKTYVYYASGKKAEGEAVLAALADSAAVLEESTLASPDMVLVVFGK